jgi:hypothetical protein
MTDLMTEVYVADGYLNTVVIDSARKLMPVLYQNIFDRFGIDSAQFAKNVEYYYGNPIETEKLVGNVRKVLTKYERDAIRQDSIKQVYVRDSINRVQHWTRLAQEARQLILNVYQDTTAYEIEENNISFFARASLNVQRHELYKPTAIDPDMADEAVSEEEQTDSLSTEPVAELSDSLLILEKPREILPSINDTIFDLPRPFRLQRFDLEKIKQNLQ